MGQGTSLLWAAFRAGIRLETDCGGLSRCGKCKVIAPKGVSPLNPREREHLTPLEVRNKVRLACQAFIRAPAEVTLLSAPSGKGQILEEGISPSVLIQPAIEKYYLNLTEEDLKREQPVYRIIEDSLLACGIRKPALDFSCLKALPLLLSNNQGRLTAIVRSSEVIGFETGDTTDRCYGLAVDIGTTTVVGYLIDLNQGRLIGVDSGLNKQSDQGSDVVSRIEYALNIGEGLKQLQEAVIATINSIIEKLCYLGDISSDYLYSLVIVGNTPMNHLFWGMSPRFLSRFPYNPLTTGALCVPSSNLGIKMSPLGRVFSLPLVSGFIGSDTVGVVLATGLHKSRVPRIAMDIGTNGEIVITDGKTLAACSVAAGPAFEGAHIQCGMRAASGAIDRVSLDGDEVRYHVIDDVPPKGICGSGLVDAVAAMLQAGLITFDGRLLSGEEIANTAYARLMNREKFNQFLLTGQRNKGPGKEVVITQKDIREVQLAKGAMRAGIKILLDKLGLQEEDVREVYLAGAFGNYINPESATAIGLLPDFKKCKVTQVGNAAGSGAKMALLSTKALKTAARIAEQIEYVELARVPEFQKEFVKGMLLPI